MITTLQFNEEERNEFLLSVHGKDFALSLYDIREQIYKLRDNENITEEIDKVLDNVLDLIYDSMEKYGVNLDMIE